MTSQDAKMLIVVAGAVTTILSASITIYEAYKYFGSQGQTIT